MTNKNFEKLVADIGFSSVPERFRNKLENVALTVEDEPSKEVVKDVGLSLDETLLGLYIGIPHTERGESYGLGGALLDKIISYRLPTLEMAEGEGISVRKVIEDTIWHEVAHHFGLDEYQVEEKEKNRRIS